MWLRSPMPIMTTPMWKVSRPGASSAFISSSNSLRVRPPSDAMLARHLHAAVAGKSLDQPAEEALGEARRHRPAACRRRPRGNGRDVAGAGRLLLRGRRPRQREPPAPRRTATSAAPRSAHVRLRPAHRLSSAAAERPAPLAPPAAHMLSAQPGRKSMHDTMRHFPVPAARRQHRCRSRAAAGAQPAAAVRRSDGRPRPGSGRAAWRGWRHACGRR